MCRGEKAFQVPLSSLDYASSHTQIFTDHQVTHLRKYGALGKRERIGAINVRRKIGVPDDFGSITDGFGIAENP